MDMDKKYSIEFGIHFKRNDNSVHPEQELPINNKIVFVEKNTQNSILPINDKNIKQKQTLDPSDTNIEVKDEKDKKASIQELVDKLINDMFSMSTIHGVNYLSSAFENISRQDLYL